MSTFVYIGPPGTGKTSTLLGSAEKNAQVYGPAGVAACSYTKAAAAVLSSREFPLPEKNIGTLHSFAYRALGCPKLAVGQEKDFNQSQNDFRLSPAKRNINDPFSDAADVTLGDRAMARLEIDRAFQRPPQEKDMEFAAAWTKWKRDAGLMDFSDLLEECLRDVPAMPENPGCIIGDEVQDMSRLQLALLRKWGAEAGKLILAGDPAQCLFSFAGSDPECLAELDVPPDQRHTLDQSYRLPSRIHALAERWLTAKHPTPLLGRSYRPRDFEGTVERSGATWKRPEPIIAQAQELTAAGQSVMILASCGYILNPTVAIMRKRGIPFANRYRPHEGRWNPLAPGRVVKGQRITTAVDRVLAFLGTGNPGWSCHDLHLWGSLLESHGRIRRGGKDWLASLKGNASNINFSDLVTWLEPTFLAELDRIAFHDRNAVRVSLQIWLDAMLKSKRAVMEYPCRVLDRHGREALEAPPLLTVGTVHSVKGGEAQHVFLFPDMSRAAYEAWPRQRGPLVRTMYVGMTRAKERLVLCASCSGNMAVSW